MEAGRVFYSENWFVFFGRGSSNYTIPRSGSMLPFLKDRSQWSRHFIKKIEYHHFQSHWDYPNATCLQHTFQELSSYLGQNLQLERLTLFFPARIAREPRVRSSEDEILLDIDKQGWVQQLVPLVKSLKTLQLVARPEDADLARAAQTYLESVVHKASITVHHSHIKPE